LEAQKYKIFSLQKYFLLKLSRGNIDKVGYPKQRREIFDFSSPSNLYRFTLSGSLTLSISAVLTNITAKMGCKGKKFF
jgi:hypothetical protein